LLGRFRRKTVLLLGALTIVASGCGGAGGTESGTDKAVEGGVTAKEPAKEKKEPIELVFKDATFGWSADDFMKDYGAAIEQKFPHIQVSFIPYPKPAIAELFASKTKFDIVISSLLMFNDNMLENGLQYDLTPLIKKHKYNLDRLEPTALALAKQLANGGIYGLPVAGAASTIVYNKTLFDKFGVAYPKDGMTWDEFYELSRKMSRIEGDVRYHGSLVYPNFMLYRNPFSLSLINANTEKADFSSSKWKEYMEAMLGIYRLPNNHLDKRNQFGGQVGKELFEKDQVVAMYLNASGTGIRELTFKNMDYDFVQFPAFQDAPGLGPQPYPLYFYLSAASELKEEAFEVLTYLTSDEFQLENSKKGILTALNNKDIQMAFAQNYPEFKNKNIKAILPAKLAPSAYRSKYDGIARGELEQAFISAAMGEKDINTAMREAEDSANKKIDQVKAQKK